MRRIFAFLALCVFACTFAATHPGTGHAASEVVIGNILPLSGSAAPIGMVGRQIRELAVEEINGSGGIQALGGAKIKMVYADSRGDPKIAISEAERLINVDKVSLITGAFQSAVSFPSTEVAERYKIPYVVPVSVKDEITERGFKYVFRIAAKASWYARDQVRFLEAMSKIDPIQKVALVYENTDWGQSTAEGWTPLLKEAGMDVVLDEPYPATTPDITPVVMKIKRARPDAILFVSYAADAILLMNTMAELMVDVKAMVGSGGGHADPTFIKNTGKNCLYFFDAVEWAADLPRPGLKELNDKFKEKYGTFLSPEAANVYAAMYVIKAALEKAASTDPQKIAETLRATDFSGGKGFIVAYDKVTFDEQGQNPQAGLIVQQILMAGGEIDRVTVWPPYSAREGFKPVYPVPKWSERK
jgi:branched-chain amino acid transport system substrate-binding protein